MRAPDDFIKYAQECERLARELPTQHRQSILNIAKAWRDLAADMQQGSDSPARGE